MKIQMVLEALYLDNQGREAKEIDFASYAKEIEFMLSVDYAAAAAMQALIVQYPGSGPDFVADKSIQYAKALRDRLLRKL